MPTDSKLPDRPGEAAAAATEDHAADTDLVGQLHSVISVVPLVLWNVDPDGVFTLAEGRGLEQLSSRPGEVVGLSAFDVLEDSPEASAQVRRGLSGEEFEAEFELGGRHWHTHFVPRRNRSGVVIGLLGVSVDVTERARAELALREERERLRGIIDGTNAGTWEWNVQTGETVFNDRWAAFVGYTLEELAPISIETWTRLAHPDDLEASGKLLAKHFRGEADSYECESRMRHKDGRWIWVLDKGKVTTWTEDGQPLLMLGTHQDITRRKAMEEEKAGLESQLQQAQKLESIGRLAGGVAHELNNMLAVILGHTELAMEHLDPAQPLSEDLQAIQKAARRSADLTRQLLAFARRQTIMPRVLDLNEAVGAALGMLERLVGEGIVLRWSPGEGVWPVRIDPSQIDQLLANLLVNAREAITGAGRVAVETCNVALDEQYARQHAVTPGDYVRLTVSDSGCGIDRDTLPHVFEPFYTTKELGKGTGLGLATVYGIVRQNSGAIDIDSEPGRGTTVSVHLPRHGASLTPPPAARAE